MHTNRNLKIHTQVPIANRYYLDDHIYSPHPVFPTPIHRPAFLSGTSVPMSGTQQLLQRLIETELRFCS